MANIKFALLLLLLLNEPIASRVVIVILSGSDGRNCFWSQLNKFKTVIDRPYVSMWSETPEWTIECAYP